MTGDEGENITTIVSRQMGSRRVLLGMAPKSMDGMMSSVTKASTRRENSIRTSEETLGVGRVRKNARKQCAVVGR